MENYIGPFWSDGKWQESVEFGASEPLSPADAAARRHDSAYAHFKDRGHRIAADSIFAEDIRASGNKTYLADVPLYGNHIKNSLSMIGSHFVSGLKYGGLLGGLGSLVYSGIKGVHENYDTILNGDRYRSEVLRYYETDPMKRMLPEKTQSEHVVQVNKTPKAPQTIEIQEMPKNNKIHITNENVPPVKLLRKKVFKPDAAMLLLFLKYHPNRVAEVERWIETHPELQYNPPPNTNKQKLTQNKQKHFT